MARQTRTLAQGPTLRDRLDCGTHEVLEYDRKSAKTMPAARMDMNT
jgi:hypothetical protein